MLLMFALIIPAGINLGKKSIWLLLPIPSLYVVTLLLDRFLNPISLFEFIDDHSLKSWVVSSEAILLISSIAPLSEDPSFSSSNANQKKVYDQNNNEEKYKSIFESLYDVYYQTDLHGKITMISPSIKIRAGYEPLDIIGRKVTDFYADPDARNILMTRLKEKGSVHDFETKLVANDGQIFHVEISSKVMFDKKGSPIGIEGTLHDITERIENETKLKESSEKIKLLSAHIRHNYEEERARFSREIHDEIGQEFEAIKMEMAQLRNAITVMPIRERITKVISNMDDSITKVRRIAMELRPGILDDIGLIAAVEWQGQEFERRTGIKFIFSSSINEFAPDTTLSNNLYRVFQEALSNVEKHSAASAVEVKIKLTNGKLIFEIKDNGKGFDVQKARSKATVGLLGIFERISLINGYLSINSKENAGTEIQLSIPIIIN